MQLEFFQSDLHLANVHRCSVEIVNQVVTSVHFKLDPHRYIFEKEAEGKQFEELLGEIRRERFYAPLSVIIGLVKAWEKINELQVSQEIEILRTIFLEMENLSRYCQILASVFLVSGDDYSSSRLTKLAEKIESQMYSAFESNLPGYYALSGGFKKMLRTGFYEETLLLMHDILKVLKRFHNRVQHDPILKSYLVGHGRLLGERLQEYSLLGYLLRASGVGFDLRRVLPYLFYTKLKWEVVSQRGDDVDAGLLVKQCFMEAEACCRYILKSFEYLFRDNLSRALEKELKGGRSGEGSMLLESTPGVTFIFLGINDKAQVYRCRIVEAIDFYYYYLEENLRGGTLDNLLLISACLGLLNERAQ